MHRHRQRLRRAPDGAADDGVAAAAEAALHQRKHGVARPRRAVLLLLLVALLPFLPLGGRRRRLDGRGVTGVTGGGVTECRVDRGVDRRGVVEVQRAQRLAHARERARRPLGSLRLAVRPCGAPGRRQQLRAGGEQLRAGRFGLARRETDLLSQRAQGAKRRVALVGRVCRGGGRV